MVIINTVGRDAVIDKISVRGQECRWSKVYYWRNRQRYSFSRLECDES
ncbi:hypothetical protein KEJ37_01780 [Candidatus Bathyarchaeota archaeon]|nr:hypothetical protein [Candidatus Bathyarchaeota archaeon]